MKQLLRVRAVRKALAALLGGGGATLAYVLPDGITSAEAWSVAAAAVGAAVATWWSPPNVPNYADTPQDTP